MGAGICDWETFSRGSVLHPWAKIALGREKYLLREPQYNIDKFSRRSSNFTPDLDLIRSMHVRRSRYEEFSPLKRVTPDPITGELAVTKAQCVPTLILHGAADEDVPPDQAKKFYTALQRLGVESSLVLYKGASHSVSAEAQMLDAASRVVVHFGDHLQLDPATVAKVVGKGSLR